MGYKNDGSNITGWLNSGVSIISAPANLTASIFCPGNQSYGGIDLGTWFAGMRITFDLYIANGGAANLAEVFLAASSAGVGTYYRFDSRSSAKNTYAPTTGWSTPASSSSSTSNTPGQAWVNVQLDVIAQSGTPSGLALKVTVNGTLLDTIPLTVGGGYFALYGNGTSPITSGFYVKNIAAGMPSTIPVVTEINGAGASRSVNANLVSDGTLAGSIVTAADGTGSIAVYDQVDVMVYAFDDYGEHWIASTSYGANAKTFPTTPNGHWYQTTAGGTSGTTEPAWPTNGSTVTDNTVTWTDMGTMRAPVIQGPFIPVPVS